jgi:hypothetical protein
MEGTKNCVFVRYKGCSNIYDETFRNVTEVDIDKNVMSIIFTVNGKHRQRCFSLYSLMYSEAYEE